jgi:pimeloyl-ACP methyl ester carboxylesterase
VIILLVVVSAIVVGLAILWWQQERILFQPPAHIDIGDIAADKVEYQAADGQPLFGFLVGSSSSSGVLLSFHGNADLAVWQLEWASEVVRRFGLAVFLAEYRGYGGIPGKPTYAASSLDSEAAYSCLIQQLHFPRDQIFLFGHSLGSAIAAELALRHPVSLLLLQAPFTSARGMARATFSPPVTALWKLISRIHFDVVAAVQAVDARVSVIHGTRDLVIPSRMGETVYRAAKVKGAFALIENAGHNNIVEVAGEDYWRWFASALLPTAE